MRSILFLDDDASALESFRLLLEGRYEVITAQTVEEALKYLREREIPIVVADYKMDPINGIEFLKQVQVLYPETIRIMLTAYKNVSLMTEAINQAHVWGYFQKPLVGQEKLFINYLNQVLEVYDLRMELKKKNRQLEQAYEKISHQNDELTQKNEALGQARAKLEEYSHHLEKRVEERTRQLFEEQKFGLIGKMSTQVAHDLKGPYDSFQTFRDLLRDRIEKLGPFVQEKGKGIYEELKGFVEQDIQVAVELMGNMVEGLNAYGRSVGKVEEVDVVSGIDKILKLYATRWRGRIEVKRVYDLIPKIRARGGEIVRIWSNLLGNSGAAVLNCERCRGGRGEIGIQAQSQEREKRVGIEVKIRDNGSGMSEEVRQRVFDPFYTTKKEGEGMGLGMAIVKQVVESHGGTISVESELGSWTEFTVWLPVEAPLSEGGPR
ncbi:MAG: hybrid sensor histidine kinase/response regulator [Deltaproteobacteria bacterium]|nr:hybrid sensor histidine kinase/response regulator [Deltaproteobacteria bacterium]